MRLAYIRCAAQPDDDLAFERIFNTPKRGLGETTLAGIVRFAREHRIPLLRAARELSEGTALKPRARGALKALVGAFDRWGSVVETMAPEQFAQMVIDESGLIAMWEAERTEEARGRLENLREFVRSIGEFASIAEFLEHVSLVVEAEGGEQGPKVSVMTLHSAKGLEFDVVFLPGWEEGLFPHPRSLEESGVKGLEEERRLAYVGITRARRRVRIYHAANRRVRGYWQSSIPSRFVEELPSDQVATRDSDTRLHWIPSAPQSSRFDQLQPRAASSWSAGRAAEATVTLRHVAPSSSGPPAQGADRSQAGRAGVPPEIRNGHGGQAGWRPPDDRLRPCRAQGGAGVLCRVGRDVVRRRGVSSRAMDRLDCDRMFLAVYETGSFSLAARRLGVSSGQASKLVSRLESELGVQLLSRTTRALSPTEVGRAYYERSRALIAEFDALDDSVRSAAGEASGRLVLTAPNSFGVQQLMPALIAFAGAYPKIRLDVSFSDRTVNLLDEGFDAAVRVGSPDDSSLIARKLCPMRVVVVASPDYLARAGVPMRPDDLAAHECIIDANRRDAHIWRFRAADGSESRVTVDGRLRFSNGEACIAAAVAGHGIAFAPTFLAGPRLRDGALKLLLPAFENERAGVFALYPASRHLAAKVRALIEFLVAEFRGVPSWDQGW